VEQEGGTPGHVQGAEHSGLIPREVDFYGLTVYNAIRMEEGV